MEENNNLYHSTEALADSLINHQKHHYILSLLSITHLCFPASFPSIVPEGSYALEVSAWVSHLKMNRDSLIKSF